MPNESFYHSIFLVQFSRGRSLGRLKNGVSSINICLFVFLSCFFRRKKKDSDKSLPFVWSGTSCFSTNRPKTIWRSKRKKGREKRGDRKRGIQSRLCFRNSHQKYGNSVCQNILVQNTQAIKIDFYLNSPFLSWYFYCIIKMLFKQNPTSSSFNENLWNAHLDCERKPNFLTYMVHLLIGHWQQNTEGANVSVFLGYINKEERQKQTKKNAQRNKANIFLVKNGQIWISGPRNFLSF